MEEYIIHRAVIPVQSLQGGGHPFDHKKRHDTAGSKSLQSRAAAFAVKDINRTRAVCPHNNCEQQDSGQRVIFVAENSRFQRQQNRRCIKPLPLLIELR